MTVRKRQGGLSWLNPRQWAWIDAALPYYRAFNRLLPTDARCKRCWAPLRGPFALLHQLFLIRASHKNPRLCTT